MRRTSLLALLLLVPACTSATADTWPALVDETPAGVAPAPSTTVTSTTTTTTTTTTTLPPTTTTTEPPRPQGVVPASTVGEPWGSTVGLTMFRGNPTRTHYGQGPLPTSPRVQWRFPDRPMCGTSSSGGETKQWCGTGWTGQPAVWVRPDGITEVVFGAYDKRVHFLDAATGERTRPDFPVGDLIKGSVTIDPDGYPLLYFGSRDNELRVVALDRDEPTQLWSLNANAVAGIWNNDWDGNPVIVDDVMYEGGENSWFFAIKLNRSLDGDGLVTVAPEIVVQLPGYDQALLNRVGSNVSIEGSVAVWEQTAYFANSGGRVVGLDVSRVEEGEAPIVFDYWAGDDIDATLVVDAEGMVYAAVEMERFNARSKEVGQLVKLDPTAEDDPRVWGVAVPPRFGGDGGIWATPALGDGVIYVNTHPGELIGVDTETGDVVWREPVEPHAWSSPVIVDGALVSATCDGRLRAWTLEDPRSPTPLWDMQVSGACIESTPAVWNGQMFVGSRDGYFYAIGD